MKTEKIIFGNNVNEIWSQVTTDLKQDFLEYAVIIHQQNRKIWLAIDADPGGGFESGYPTTILRSRLLHENNFKLAVYHQGFPAEIGKFFGMEDIETGFEELDKKIIIKATDTAKAKLIFTDKNTRQVFMQLKDFNFHITHAVPEADNKEPLLELYIQEAIIDLAFLRQIYTSFYSALLTIDS